MPWYQEQSTPYGPKEWVKRSGWDDVQFTPYGQKERVFVSESEGKTYDHFPGERGRWARESD
jgi:hypothetical protein